MRVETLIKKVAGKESRRIKLEMSMAEWSKLYRDMCSSNIHLSSYRQMGRVDNVTKIMFGRKLHAGMWWEYEDELRVDE